MAVDRHQVGVEPGNRNQREAEYLGVDRLDRRIPGRASLASQPRFCRVVFRRGESGGSVGPQHFGRGPDICQLRCCAGDTSRLSHCASPRRDHSGRDCDGSRLSWLVRWRDGPRRGIPCAIAVAGHAGSCGAVLPGDSAEGVANSKPRHCQLSIAFSVTVAKPIKLARSISDCSRCSPFATGIPQTGPRDASTTSTSASAAAAVPQPLRSASVSVGL